VTDRGEGNGTTRTTSRFAALLARSILVCVLGGAFFGALMTFGLDLLSGYRAGKLGPIDASFVRRLLLDGTATLLVEVSWGVLLCIPLGIPAGAIAAGLIWWLRGSPWVPSSRTRWTLLGSISGLVIGAVGSPLALIGFAEVGAVLPIAGGVGACCGALLAWIVSPELIEERRGRITTG